MFPPSKKNNWMFPLLVQCLQNCKSYIRKIFSILLQRNNHNFTRM